MIFADDYGSLTPDQGLERLNVHYGDFNIYCSGFPNAMKNSARDSLLSAILMLDKNMLKDQLSLCAEKQGLKQNPLSGEEPGKIFNEFPASASRGLSNEYNACDTTALFLIGHEVYQKLSGDILFADRYKDNIIKAVGFIRNHLKGYSFIEDPSLCGGKHFSLKVTYWKDTGMPERENGEPVYPVSYSLPHIQNMRALKSASFLLKDDSFGQIIECMKDYLLNYLFSRNTGQLCLAIDRNGPIKTVSSDILHSLFFLDEGDITPEHIESIINSSFALETDFGYRSFPEDCVKHTHKGSLHYLRSILPVEQALVNIGAKKHRMWIEKAGFTRLSKGLKKIEDVSSIINGKLTSVPEGFILEDDKIKKTGCDPYLLTIATKKYFDFKLGDKLRLIDILSG
ncbi:MAG: hypothetical protein NUV64_03525 [Parcubacteria group bacterium]|nr:hypothetical protein [Parcubacteria group bacterium]MCR4342343.1 hypothetical protein [Patescibacteria group bacterium]